MHNFALLTTINHPLLNGYLGALEKLNLDGFCVFLDSKLLSNKNLKLIRKRIGDWDPGNEYNFSKYKTCYKSPFFYLENHNSEQTLNLIKENNLQFLVNAGTPRKISIEIIKNLPKGVLNVHPGNLIKYRGQDTPEWALLNKDPIEITAHLMGEEYDNGPKILSRIFNLKGIETYQEFRRMIYKSIFEVTAIASKELLLHKTINSHYKNETNSGFHNAMPEDILENLIKKNFMGKS